MAKPGSKVFHDPIHGSMEFEPVLVKIIDTPEFQRLRRIKQLGAGCYVYPGATHTRFEHSLGVCHLAGKFAEHLKEKTEKDNLGIQITPEQILCIKVAGLCHDIGHGPFSHMFEDFAKKAMPSKKWKHEQMSVKILTAVVERVAPELRGHITFIAKLITGVKNEAGQTHFLYQIVANKDTGIDVDKWDYFARDCHYLGLSNDFQWKRCMMLADVKEVGNGDYQICYRDSAIANIYAMFRTRSTLHQKAYQHIRVKAVEHMMIDCLINMMELKLPGLQKSLKGILEDLDTDEYVKLDDSIVESLQEPVPGIIDRLRTRKLYHYLGFAKMKDLQLKALKDKLKEDAEPEQDISNKHLEGLIEENIKARIETEDMKQYVDIAVVEVKFGSEEKSPLENLWFYSSTKQFKIKEDLSDQIHLGGLLLPKKFHQCEVRLYSKKADTSDDECDLFLGAFEVFLRAHNAFFGDLNEGKFGKYFSMTKGK